MSSTQEGSSGCKVKGKKPAGTRRSWTENEEMILMAAVKELIVKGWKSDNGFRAGYLNKLEDAIKSQLPETDIKSTPHISSKLQIWKKNYYSLSSIMAQSGVGFNSDGVSYKIDCEDQTWDGLVKADGNAKLMRYKSWPYYYEWKEIFGRDRANGNTAEDIVDAWNEVRSQEKSDDGGLGVDYDVLLEDLAENECPADSNSNTQKSTQLPRTTGGNKKRKAASDDISDLCTVLREFGRKTDARLADLVDSIGYDARLGQAAEDAFAELSKIEGLSMEQRFDVCEVLSANVDKVKIFKGLPDAARREYVNRLIKNNGK